MPYSQKEIQIGSSCLALSLILLLHSPAHGTSAAVGAEMGAAITQKMLSAPALPSLDGGRNSVGVSYGVSNIEMSDSLSGSTSVVTANGTGKGQQFGLSLTVPTKSDFGFFFFAVSNQSSGEVHIFQDGMPTYDMRDIKANAYAAVGGISYRLLGSETSVFAMGPFAGPAVVSMRTSSTFAPQGSVSTGEPTYFTMDPLSYGVFIGVQAVLRIGHFRINPYGVLLSDTSDTCKPVTANGPTLPYNCEGQEGKMAASTSFVGGGLYLGYRWLQFNAYSDTFLTSRFKISAYAASIGIPF